MSNLNPWLSCGLAGVASTLAGFVQQGTAARPAKTIEVTCLAVSPLHAIAAAGCSDGSVRVFDLASGKTIAVAESTTRSLARLAWSPDGKKIAAADFVPLDTSSGPGPFSKTYEYLNGTANWRVIDAQSGAVIDVFQSMQPGHDNPGCVWRPDAGALVTWGCEPFAELRTFGSLPDRRRLEPQRDARITCVAWAGDGWSLFCGDSRGRLEMRNAESGALLRSRTTEMSAVRCLRVSNDGGLLFAGGAISRLGCWSTDELERKWEQQQGEGPFDTDWVSSIDLDPTGAWIVAAVRGWGSVQRWSIDGARGWIVDYAGGNEAGLHVRLDPFGRHVLSWGLGRRDRARMYSAATGALEFDLSKLDVSGGAGSLAWSADGGFIALRTNLVEVFDGRTYQHLRTWYPCGIVAETVSSRSR